MPRLIPTLLLLTSLTSLAHAQQGVLRPRQVVIREVSPTPVSQALVINNSTPSLRVQMGVTGADIGSLGMADALGVVTLGLSAVQDETSLVMRDGALNLGVQLGFQTGGAGSLRLHSDPVGNSLLFKADDSTAGFASMLILASGAALNINGSTTTNGEIVLNPGAVSTNGKVIINSAILDDHALSIEGISGQTARVFEINDSLGVRVFHIEGEGSLAPGDMVSESHFPVATGAHVIGSTANAWQDMTSLRYVAGLRPVDVGGTGGGSILIANVTNNNYAQLVGVASSGNADIEMRSTFSVVDAFLPGDPNIDSLGLAAERWDAFIDDLNVVTCVGCGAASHPVLDTTIIITGDVDPTKRIRFEVDGLTTLTDRVLTVQDANHILAGTNITNEFSVNQRWSNDTRILFEDTVGTAINTIWLDSSNFLNIGTIDAITGDGDVIFYSDGNAVAKLIDSQDSTGVAEKAFSPNVDRVDNIGGRDQLWDEIHGEDLYLGRGTSTTEVQGALRMYSGTSAFSFATTIQADTLGSIATLSIEWFGGPFVPGSHNSLDIGFDDGTVDRRPRKIYTVDLDISGTCTGCGGGLPVVDTTSIVEGSADPTKEIRFEVDGLTTGTVRVLTPPNADTTLVGSNLAQTWTAVQTFEDKIGIKDPAGAGVFTIQWQTTNTELQFKDTVGAEVLTFQAGVNRIEFHDTLVPNGAVDIGLSGLSFGTLFANNIGNSGFRPAVFANALDATTGVFSGTLSSGTHTPASGASDLGLVGNPWDDIWFDREIAGGGTVGMAWNPDTDSTRDLGNDTTQTWRNFDVENIQLWTTGDVMRIEMNNTIASFTQLRFNNDSGTRRIDIGIDANDASVSLIASVASRNVALFTGSAANGLLVGGIKVVGAQCSSLPVDATDLATVITLANAMKDCMNENNHGLADGT